MTNQLLGRHRFLLRPPSGYRRILLEAVALRSVWCGRRLVSRGSTWGCKSVPQVSSSSGTVCQPEMLLNMIYWRFWNRKKARFWGPGPLKSIKKRANIDRNSNLEARSGYNSMLEADKFEFGAQDKVFSAILGQLGSNLEAQKAPKADPELNSRGFSSVFARFLNIFPRSKAKSEN